jgi:hypothetical protein
VTRLLREHPPIEVELDAEGALVAIRWNGRREAVEVCNRWRIEPGGASRSRAIFKSPATAGWPRLLDRVDGTWHLERLYDESPPGRRMRVAAALIAHASECARSSLRWRLRLRRPAYEQLEPGIRQSGWCGERRSYIVKAHQGA